ncbi:collagen alpha-1(I) chain-like isoform X1 [Homo sapiens]|uniref:collagen alpha-1(I) chain-like isoform X1 n=1 Tax=Homo sapiens TaxID=9606 RepID=UPI001FB06A5C|nr:collagen alpha-1(I) chain-like isoform X1 [Homo sapiens]XP_047272434.1 collagen alpha-1(I) chain-like isoform X1 [Homo sapiens]
MGQERGGHGKDVEGAWEGCGGGMGRMWGVWEGCRGRGKDVGGVGRTWAVWEGRGGWCGKDVGGGVGRTWGGGVGRTWGGGVGRTWGGSVGRTWGTVWEGCGGCGKDVRVAWKGRGGAVGITRGWRGPCSLSLFFGRGCQYVEPRGVPCGPAAVPTFPAATSFEVALPEAPQDVSGELRPDFGHSRQCLWGERHPPAGLPPPPAPRRQMGSSKGLRRGVRASSAKAMSLGGGPVRVAGKRTNGAHPQVPIEGPLQRRFKEPSPRVGGLGPAPGGQRRPQAWRTGWSGWRALQGEWEETGKPGRGSAGRRQGCVGQGGLHSLASSWPGWAPSSSLGQLRRRPREESPCSGPRDLLPSLESLSWPRCRDTLPSLAGGLVSAGRGGNVGQRFQVWPGARGSGRKNTQRGLPGRGLTSQPAVPTPQPAEASPHSRRLQRHSRRLQPRSRRLQPRSRRLQPRSRRLQPRSRRPHLTAGGSNPAAGGSNPAAGGSNPAAGVSNPAAGGSNPAAGGSNPAAGGSGLRTTGRAPQAAPPPGLCPHRRPLEMARGWCP